MIKSLFILVAFIVAASSSQELYREVACERDHLLIECDGLIQIVSANYGRTELNECPSDGSESQEEEDVDLNCINAESLEIVQQRCHDRSVCEIPVRNGVFGDPCEGTRKYLEVTYRCIPAEVAIACEGSTLDVTCPNGDVINVLSANYGRTIRSTEVCEKYRGVDLTTECISEASLPRVHHKCQGKRKCNLKVTPQFLRDEPCPRASKYLNVTYMCDNDENDEPPRIHNEVECKGEKMRIRCPSGETINILDANYGRTMHISEVCTRTAHHRDATNCVAENSLDIVRESCQGEASCSVEALNSVFSDPCRRTYKYLEMVYQCETQN